MKDGSIETRLVRYLLNYRVTPHSTTGISPCKLLKGRQLRTILDAVQPSVGRKVHLSSQEKMTNYYNHKSKERCFSPGDAVYVRNHTENSPMWIPAVLKEMHNDLLVSEATDGRRLRRHSNHVRLRHADASDDRILADVAAPAKIHQPTDRDVDSEDDTSVPGDNSVNSPAMQSAVRKSERIRKAPDRLSL